MILCEKVESLSRKVQVPVAQQMVHEQLPSRDKSGRLTQAAVALPGGCSSHYGFFLGLRRELPSRCRQGRSQKPGHSRGCQRLESQWPAGVGRADRHSVLIWGSSQADKALRGLRTTSRRRSGPPSPPTQDCATVPDRTLVSYQPGVTSRKPGELIHSSHSLCLGV